jgi:DNA gyrase subunit A
VKERFAFKKPQIAITSIPYGTDKSKLEADIGAIIESKKLPDLLNSTNESNEKVGLRISLDIRPNADPAKIMAYLYKHTDLQQTYSYNMTCLIPNPNDPSQLRPEPNIGLDKILDEFLKFRLATVRRRFQYDLRVLRRRIHLLQGFKIIFDALDKAIKMIRESSGKQDAAEKLKKAFALDDEQTTAILDAQLYKIAQMEIQKILEELEEKTKEAKRIESILKSESKLWLVVKDELNALAESKAVQRRKTRMASDEDVLEFNEESYIVRENTNVVLTRDGWIKRVGRLASVEGTRVREGDEVIAVVPGNTLDHVVFFADDGTAYTMRMNEVPASSGYGEPITKFFKIADQVKIIDAASTDPRFVPEEMAGKRGDPKGPYLLAVTQWGYSLRTPLAPFRIASTKAGRRYVRLDEGDKVVMAKVLKEEESLFLASRDGHVIHFLLNQINVLSGAGKGVIGIKLDDGDICIGGALVSNRHDALTVETSGGITKEFRRGAHPTVNRGGKGTEVVKRAELSRIVPPPIELVDWETLLEGNGKSNHRVKDVEKNGDGHKSSLFDE